MMRYSTAHLFTGARVGLAVVALGAIFALVILPGTARVADAADRPDPLRSWSTARILEELGEYDEKIPDCAGLVPGMNGYAFARTDAVGQLSSVVIVCKP